MPLLRRKPFVPEKASKNLKGDDEVFFCDMTGEIFQDYEAFYQRIILCNSLVWSCELTGRPNLTYKEALDSEDAVKKSISQFPFPLKKAALILTHQTWRSKIQDLVDDIYEYLRNRYQPEEKVEVKVSNKKWVEGRIISCPNSEAILTVCNGVVSPAKNLSTDSLELTSKKSRHRNKGSMLLNSKSSWSDASSIDYKVEVKVRGKAEVQTVKGKSLRRPKGVFVKDKLKLFMKTSCMRTTISTDDGYWVVIPDEVRKHSLGLSCIIPDPPKSSKKKKKKSINEMLLDAGQKQNKKEKTLKELQKIEKAKRAGKNTSERPKELTLEQKRVEYEKEKERKKIEFETLKLNKIKEKEEEKARKKNEREKEREVANALKKLELEFLKEYNKPKEDLSLEDSKPLPSLVPFKSTLDQNLIGDAIMVVEFVNIFGSLFNLEQEIEEKVTLAWLEEALAEHDAERKYYQILKFLLHSYLRTQQDENKIEDDEDELSTSGENTPAQQLDINEDAINDAEEVAKKIASTNARAAAIWPMLYQGMALREITIEPYSLTEVLRLHILSSGVKIGGITDYADWQRRGQYQYSDDPCVSFRHEEQEIMTKLMTCSVYDLDIAEKLKLLVLLSNQALMLSTVRDFMDEAFEKVKSLRKELRELQHEENKRRRTVQQEKWKKKLEERSKLKEENEKKKSKKLEKSTDGKAAKLNLEKDSRKSVPENALVDGDDVKDKENENMKTLEELQGEKKNRKEAKEIQIEEFFRDKFCVKEKELLREISQYSAVISEVPLGKDRTFRRYWKFFNVDGLLTENDDNGALKLIELNGQDIDEYDEAATEDEEERDLSQEKNMFPKVMLCDIVNARENGQPLETLIFNRYKCLITKDTEKGLLRSNILKPIFDKIQNGVDPAVYGVRDQIKWYSVVTKEQYEALLHSMNPRGNREQSLKVNLSNERKDMIEYYNQIKAMQEQPSKKQRGQLHKKAEPNEIDKTLFRTMTDYMEASLRDQLLELEERLWVASVAGITNNRDAWRANLEDGIAILIQSESEALKDKTISQDTSMEVDDKQEVKQNTENGDLVNGSHNETELMTIDRPEEQLINGNSEKEDVTELTKAVPLHLKSSVNEKEQSRCCTPVEVSKTALISTVQVLSEALLQIERSIERKFLKPPLGETEEIKKERIKVMIQTANAEFEMSKQKELEKGNGNEGEIKEEEEEEDKKPPTVLNRWEESLIKCTSFSQIFLHLNTLDRSVMWDKSIQNTKCRLCKRKGNEEEMLLCDGCDRGFHMGCLKPPLKKVPVGDWFCHDCRPSDVKRRSRKHSRVQEETEEDDDDESDEETEEEDSDDDNNDEQSEEDSEDEDQYKPDDSEDENGSEASEHGEQCTVCDGIGTLILCEDCPRSYHIECCYPPLKKVPRGVWKCQICTGSDTDLPYRRRAMTIERTRERARKEKTAQAKGYKKQRGQTTQKKQVKRSYKSSPCEERPSKRAKVDSDVDSQSTSSQRSSVGFSRQQLKNCTVLIEEIMKRKDAEVFLEPVDLAEVPDYANFIDNPMDFGTIRRNLSKGIYLDAQSLLDDVQLVFSNCETYNQPRSRVAREGAILKTFVNKKIKELNLL